MELNHKNPKYISVIVNGGLGNQLYQIFTMMQFSLKMNRPFYFKYEKYIVGHNSIRQTYWDSFLDELKPNVIHDEKELEQRLVHTDYIRENGHHYTPIDISIFGANMPETICLSGYFQSYKYFDDFFEYICIKTGIRKKQKEFIENHKNHRKCNISMHFRLGDYKGLTKIHPIMPFEYYRNALAYFMQHSKYKNNENINVLYFCEFEDTEHVQKKYIIPLEQLFPRCTFILADQRLQDWEQMLYMSNCDDNIIANSTFSLWGAKLNVNVDKIVCYPWVWFTDMYVRQDKRFVHDMFPPSWKKISWLFYDTKSTAYYV